MAKMWAGLTSGETSKIADDFNSSISERDVTADINFIFFSLSSTIFLYFPSVSGIIFDCSSFWIKVLDIFKLGLSKKETLKRKFQWDRSWHWEVLRPSSVPFLQGWNSKFSQCCKTKPHVKNYGGKKNVKQMVQG